MSVVPDREHEIALKHMSHFTYFILLFCLKISGINFKPRKPKIQVCNFNLPCMTCYTDIHTYIFIHLSLETLNTLKLEEALKDLLSNMVFASFIQVKSLGFYVNF